MKFLLKVKILPLVRTLKYSFFGILWTPVALSVIFPGDDILFGVYGLEMNKVLQDFLGYSGLILLLGFIFLSFLILSFNIPFRWLRKKEKTEIPVSDAQPDILADDQVPDEEKEVEQEENAAGNQFIPEEAVTSELQVEEESVTVKEKGTATSNIELQIEKPVEEPVAETDGADGKVHFGLDTKYDPTLDLPNYKFPHLDLLKDYGGDEINVNKEELEANKNRIVQTLNNYSIKIDKIKATIGPAVTLYEIVPEAGVRISKIKNLEDDIALSLSALGIRIIAPIPGKGTIGIEVPNKNPETVSMKSLLSSERFQKPPSNCHWYWERPFPMKLSSSTWPRCPISSWQAPPGRENPWG